jgi:peptide/nickel transport system substrate-binding protein
VQSTLRGNGVDARVSVRSWPAFFADVQEGRHEIALLGWTNIVDPDRLLYTQFLTDGDLNYGGYSNPDVDRLLVSARATLDRETRARAYVRAAHILAEEVPYFVLSYQGYQLFHRPGIVLDPDPRGYMRSVLGLKPDGP